MRRFEAALRDVRVAFRQLRKSPGFALIAICTIALGIGANTAIFTLVHAVLLKPLPVARTNELYSLGDTRLCCDTTEVQENFGLFSYPLYRELRGQAHEFKELAAFQTWLSNLGVRRVGATGLAEPYRGQFVSGNYFSMFGVTAAAGRLFSDTDDEPNASPVAVMSYRTWTQRFGADPTVIGAAFDLNGSSVTIIGVTPPEFFGDTLRSDPPAFWMPLAIEPALERDNPLLNQPSEFWLYAAGRLRPGIAPAQVSARLLPQIREWVVEHTTQRRDLVGKVRLSVLPVGNGIGRLRDSYGDGLRLLTAITGLILLVACGNVANLLLARSTARRLECSVRVAVGASRARIVRQVLTEGLLLAALGGLAGIAIAFGATRLLISLAFRGATYVPINASPSMPVIAFSAAITLVTGVIFTIAPAWLMAGTEPIEAMRGAGRSTHDRTALPQKSLLGIQAALSLVLLVGAGLLGQSLRNLENQRFGFQTQGRLVVRINPALAGYTVERLPALYRLLKERFSQLPGVTRASLALHSPMDGWNWNTQVYIDGRAPSANPDEDDAEYDFVSAGYFDAIGTRLLRGRLIAEQDQPGAHHVCVVNQAFARKFLGDQDPLGRHLGMNGISHSGDYEIVGVVEDAKYRDPKEPAKPMFFMPLLQFVRYEQPTDNAYQAWGNYIDGIQLKVAGVPETFEQAVRRTLADIDPNLTILRITTLDAQISSSFNGPRLIAQLTLLYGLLALSLASIGIYGVASYIIAQRTREIGVRMALGAPRWAVLVLTLRTSLLPIVVGLAIGVLAVLAGGRAVATQLYGVRSYDPLILGSAAAALVLSAAAATLVPARRAASIDPLRALRND